MAVETELLTGNVDHESELGTPPLGRLVSDPAILAFYAGELQLSELVVQVPLEEALARPYETEHGPLQVRGEWFKPPQRKRRQRDEEVMYYLDTVSKYPLLSNVGEVALGQRKDIGKMAAENLPDTVSKHERSVLDALVHEGKMAFDAFYKSNLLFAARTARQTKRRSMNLSDAIQSGNEGLHKAVIKFDWQKGFRFTTMARSWIQDSIQSAQQTEAGPIRIPKNVNQFLRSLDNFEADFSQMHGRDAEVADIAAFFECSRSTIIEMLRCRYSVLSLDQDLTGRNTTQRSYNFFDLIPSDELADVAPDDVASSDIEAASSRVGDTQLLRELFKHLDPEEKEIILLRFGFDGSGPRNIKETKKMTSITRDEIPKIEARALEKLRRLAWESTYSSLKPNERVE